MSNYTITPNMSLIVPNVGVNGETGPNYALEQNQDLSILDIHNHGPGSGVQITPTGLNINANLNFQNNSPYNVYSIGFSSPAATSALTTLYTNSQTGGGITDLFYNDGAGNVIALTKAGEVNATIASIPGESYSGGTFTWKQGNGSTTPANFDIGSVTIRPNVAATTNGVILGPPSAISSQYNVQLPIVPSAIGIMQLDTSGNMLATLVPDNSSIVISSQTLEVGPQGINQSMIAIRPSSSSTESNGGVAISSSSGAFGVNPGASFPVAVTNLSVTLTTFGNPVKLKLQSAGSGSASYVGLQASNGNNQMQVAFFRGATQLNNDSIELFFNSPPSGQSAANWPPGCFEFIDIVTAGTYTYTFQIVDLLGNTNPGGFVSFCVLVAYEMK